jgi:hypothetical protein
MILPRPLTFYNGIHLNTGQAPHVNPLFGPRFGFNWDVKGDQKHRFCGGVGLFAGPPPLYGSATRQVIAGWLCSVLVSNSTTTLLARSQPKS